MKLFISPHNDDETLFGAFTILREKPMVVIVFDSYVQPSRGLPYCSWQDRRRESVKALAELGIAAGEWWNHKDALADMKRPSSMDVKENYAIQFLGIHDSDSDAIAFPKICQGLYNMPQHEFEEIYFPALEPNGHAQHNLVAHAVEGIFTDSAKLIPYLTYTRTRGKSRNSEPVSCTPAMLAAKHRALACYESQMNPATGCDSWFTGDVLEYYA